MKVISINEYDIVNYKHPAMFIIFPKCSFKCDRECGENVCQNSSLANKIAVEISIEAIVERYKNNPLVHALVCGGLEPFDTYEDLFDLIEAFREKSDDPIVIYTGYYPDEIKGYLDGLKKFPKIIVKFGRFIPNISKRFDEVLGVTLASDNQYAEVIS